MLFENLIDSYNIDIDKQDQNLVTELILGDNLKHSKSWIYEIVANKRNSIDVDKFDYICRDSYHVGIKSTSIDYTKIFNSAKIIDNEICFNIKVIF